MFETNLGPVDRTIRIVFGLALLALVWTGPETPWGYVGLVPLLTGAFGYSPTYAIFRLNSRGTFHRVPKHA